MLEEVLPDMSKGCSKMPAHRGPPSKQDLPSTQFQEEFKNLEDYSEDDNLQEASKDKKWIRKSTMDEEKDRESPTPSLMNQIKVMHEDMNKNMRQLLQKAMQEEEGQVKKIVSLEDKIQENLNSFLEEKSMLEAKLSEREQNINSLQDENKMLKAEMQIMTCTLNKNQGKIKCLLQENDMLQATVKDLEHKMYESQENKKSLLQEKKMLEDEVQNMACTLYERQENINSLQKAWDWLDAKVKDLEHALYDGQQSINRLKQEKGTLEAKVQEQEHTKQRHIQRMIDLVISKQELHNTLYSSSYPMRYRLQPEKNGCALIISNTQFTTSVRSERTGAERDPQQLKEAFQSLPVKIDVKAHQNLNLSTMLNVLRDEANRDHKEEDFFICCIMTHGTQGKVFATDGFSAELLDILSLFKGKQCPTLMGKPKLFFISACQGDKDQTSEKGGAHTDASPSPILAYLSTEADFFLALATVPGYVAYRGEDGAHFVNVLAEVLKEYGKSQDLMSMMTTVSREMNKKFKYSPFCCTTLRHKLFFDDYPYPVTRIRSPCSSTLPPTIETPNDGCRQQPYWTSV
ncbi:PREDICTED: caspase-8-like isoform X2 [Branchiostoma belcheri]|uniref:Caspase-8-like isoform X2 n=1 Tax=Branchiostoma belcheri TaxID=7741 RepID=A0A6P4ZCP4_BRABE|nr:PREDICTED: caspase-8-like isoform X2 [Branchiostoma belcheri]